MEDARRALLVGIDDHDHRPRLHGCANDVAAIGPLVARHADGSPNFSCRARGGPGDRVTTDSLLGNLDVLLGSRADVALLFFAGHGQVDDGDLYLCTSDGTKQSPGVAFSRILATMAASDVAEVVVLLDCCFSGAAAAMPQLQSDAAVLRPGLSILAASRDDEPATERTTGRGAFSEQVEAALAGGAADVVGKVTVASVYAYVSESFDPWQQRPTFKANVDRLHALRACEPAVAPADLRQLGFLFPTAHHQLPLDPSFEPDEGHGNHDNEATFALLQRFRAAGLVDPVGASQPHLYFAAIESAACTLTLLGRHYWRLASRGLL